MEYGFLPKSNFLYAKILLAQINKIAARRQFPLKLVWSQLVVYSVNGLQYLRKHHED